MITRQNTPGPFHDSIMHAYTDYAKLAPRIGAATIGDRFGLFGWQVVVLVVWCRSGQRGTCPVP